MQLYLYDGPVLEFNRIISNRWKASTYAQSEKKARRNLTYQFKKQYGKDPRSSITLPGAINSIEGKDE